jgi:penicillin-binding protein 1A
MEDENQRYFPNHKISENIALAEYNYATSRINSDEQALSWATNTTVLMSTLVGYLSFQAKDIQATLEALGTTHDYFIVVVWLSVLAFSFFSIIHITHLHKSRIHSSRKIIVLRRMLGVSYGDTTLVLPNWRVEGADNPFAIKLFPGFFSYRAFPVHIVLLATLLATLMFTGPIFNVAREWAQNQLTLPRSTPAVIGAIWYTIGLLVFRYQLIEPDEGAWLWVSKITARFLGVTVTDGFFTKTYGVKLDVAEAKRLKADLEPLRKFGIHIEDRQFSQHRGINWRGVGRAIKGRLIGSRLGGGSSISQQFARSNFIVKPKANLSRKIVEMFLARWIESKWTKGQIIDAYLCTARFDYNVYGAHRGFRHFFQDDPVKIEAWEAFILIERLGNIRGKFIGDRVRELLTSSIAAGLLSREEAVQALGYYDGMLGHHFDLVEGKPTPKELIEQFSADSPRKGAISTEKTGS